MKQTNVGIKDGSTTNIAPNWVESTLQQLKSLVDVSTRNILQAADLVCQLMDREDLDAMEIADRTGVTRNFICGLERVGRKRMVPELFLGETPGARAMRKLPYDLQKKYLDQPIPLLSVTDSGKPEQLNMPYDALTAEQARSVFVSGRLRSLAEQRAYYEAQASAKLARAAVLHEPYTIRRRTVQFHQPMTLTAQDLIRLLQKLEEA